MAIRHEESEEEKKEEKEEKSFYILERRTCEILGSGSDIQEVATTKSLEEALEILKKGSTPEKTADSLPNTGTVMSKSSYKGGKT